VKLESKVAIITGGASGIGAATASLLAKEGARVVVADLNGAGGQAVVEAINATGDQAIFVRTDVTQDADAKALVDKTMATYGRIDILHNNCGVNKEADLDVMTETEWDHLFAVNVKGHFLVSRHVIPLMKSAGSGVIINGGSVAAFVGAAGYAAYHATKGAIVSLTKSMALELASFHIRVNCVCPALIKTPMHTGVGIPVDQLEAALPEALAAHPIGRFGDPEEVARVVLFLACDDSSFMTGIPLIVDGGYLAK
jgi:NAD(P)-dependent dehydrogenase (short-subunit alcohol dehydrogenase family)